MTSDRRGKFWGNVLLWIAVGCLVSSMPCIFGGLLGLLGVLADVGAAENRQIGLQSLRLAVIPAGLGGVVLVVALIVRGQRPK